MRPAFSVALFLLPLAFASAVSAEISGKVWDGGATSPLASLAENWSGDALPVSGDPITFPLGSDADWDLAAVSPSSIASSGTVTLVSPLTTGALTLSGGSLVLGSQPVTVSGDVRLSGGVLKAGSATVNVGGDWKFSGGTAELGGSTVTFTGGGEKQIVSAGNAFGNVVMNASGGTLGFEGGFISQGTFSVLSGSVRLGSATMRVYGGLTVTGGTLVLQKGTLALSGSVGAPLTVNGGSFDAGESTVRYEPTSGGVAVGALRYANLELTGAAAFTLTGETWVGGTLVIAEGATLVLSGATLSVPSGKLKNFGTIFSDGTVRSPATIVFSGETSAAVSGDISASGRVILTLTDGNANRKGSQQETATGITVTTLSGDQEVVTATETDMASGVFTSAPLIVHQGAAVQGNGQIEVGQDDIIFATYIDPTDPTDVARADLRAKFGTKVESGAPQIVAGPQVTGFVARTSNEGTTYSARFVWKTDALATSSVRVTADSLTSPLSGGSLGGTRAHEVAIEGLRRGVTYRYTVTSVTADGRSVTSAEKRFVVIAPGDRVKSSDASAVYWYLNDKRNVFPDFSAYDSWFPDFGGVVTVPAGQLADTPLGKIVPVRAGTFLVKIQSDPKVYAVEPLGTLRWVPTEEHARELFGKDWARRVRDIDVSQFVGYRLGRVLEANEIPEGFVYRVGNDERYAFAGGAARELTDAAAAANGVDARFVSDVKPALASRLQSGARFLGYAPDLNKILSDGTVSVVAPAWETKR